MLFRRTCSAGDWQRNGRRRVLIEAPEAWSWAPRLEEAGYEVALCCGPEPRQWCPLLVDGLCPTSAEAHVILSDLPANQLYARATLRQPESPTPTVVPPPATLDDLLARLG